MAKYGANHEVVNAYFSGDVEPYTNGNGSVYFANGVLYSYGNHFPMAFKLDDGRYLINGDKYSVTTSAHQSLCHSACSNGFTTSVSAIERAMRHEQVRRRFSDIKVIDTLPGVDIWNWDNGNAQKEYDALSDQDKQGVTLTYRTDKETKERYLYHAHRAETLLLKIGKGYWLCGMDDRNYFISKLPRRVKSVQEAFEVLKPIKVLAWEAKTGKQAARQGEWFFIPRVEGKEAKRIYKKMLRSNETRRGGDWVDGKYITVVEPVRGFVLPREAGSNPHTATRGYIKNRRVFVSGQVRHPEHPTCKLSRSNDPVIFEAVANMSKADFSANGQVD